MGKMEQEKDIICHIDVGFIRSYNVCVGNAYIPRKGKYVKKWTAR